MPWITPTLKQVRTQTRDSVVSQLRAVAMVPNTVTRVVSDAMAGLAYLCLLYVDWLSLQLLPDKAEEEWLERHGAIWLTNADGSRGRKSGTPAIGSVTVTGTNGQVLPQFSQLTSGQAPGILFETTQQVTVGLVATPVMIRALNVGALGNLDPGSTMTMVMAVPGIDGQATVVSLDGGTDQESIDDLRTRVLLRIQQPPMGGDATDYVQWALAVGGVTRAWSYPNEMGIGTVTVRFMMDQLRAADNGFPLPVDIAAVTSYLDSVRPVAVKDFFVVAPVPFPIDHMIFGLDDDTPATRAAIAASLAQVFFERSIPGQTWFRAWSEEAINNTVGVQSFDLALPGDVRHIPMAGNGYMPVLGNMIYSA